VWVAHISFKVTVFSGPTSMRGDCIYFLYTNSDFYIDFDKEVPKFIEGLKKVGINIDEKDIRVVGMEYIS